MKEGVYALGELVLPKEPICLITDLCDPDLARGLKQFCENKKGYGLSHPRKPIWKLMGSCLDQAAVRLASRHPGWGATELIVKAGGISALGPAWWDVADAIFDEDYIKAKRALKETGRLELGELVGGLECLRDVMGVAWWYQPRVITASKKGLRIQRTSKADNHYPFCELCWRYSRGVNDLIAKGLSFNSVLEARDKRDHERGAGQKIGCFRFCALHSRDDSTRQYRLDLPYKNAFWSAIRECRGLFVLTRNRMLKSIDATVPFVVRQVVTLYDEGISPAEIQKVTRLSSGQIEDALAWIESKALKRWREEDARVQLPSAQVIRQAAYLLVHGDVQGLIALESELPGLAVIAMREPIQNLFRKQLSERSMEIALRHREGLSNAKIAKALGVSRQLVHNALVRPLVLAYLQFLGMVSEAEAAECGWVDVLGTAYPAW